LTTPTTTLRRLLSFCVAFVEALLLLLQLQVVVLLLNSLLHDPAYLDLLELRNEGSQTGGFRLREEMRRRLWSSIDERFLLQFLLLLPHHLASLMGSFSMDASLLCLVDFYLP
jgi:hypothetical protein